MDYDSNWAARTWHAGISPKDYYYSKFQEKQLQEKEEKLLRLYESQQQRAFERVQGRRSGESTPESAISTNCGRVRQMFKSRRNNPDGAGVCKSKPLEPISKISSLKSSKNKKAIINNGFYDYNRNMYSQKDPLKRRNTNSSLAPIENMNFNSIDKSERLLIDEQFPDEHHLDLAETDRPSSIVAAVVCKLPNVVRILPSERMKLEKQQRNEMIKVSERVSAIDLNGKKDDNSENVKIKNNSQTKSTKLSEVSQMKKSPPGTTGSPKKISNTYAVSTNQNKKMSPSTRIPPRSTNATRSSPKTSDRSTPVSARSISSPAHTPRSSASLNGRPLENRPVTDDNLVPCKLCNRRFAPDRISQHETICAKTKQKKRKVFDSTKHRVEGTEAENFVLKKGTKNKNQPNKTVQTTAKGDWRKKHEDFIQAIRAAKEMQVHLAKGGKVSDLPPPPPSHNPDYVQCPHCSRKFNQQAAERHIPKCVNYQFNKPKRK